MSDFLWSVLDFSVFDIPEATDQESVVHEFILLLFDF